MISLGAVASKLLRVNPAPSPAQVGVGGPERGARCLDQFSKICRLVVNHERVVISRRPALSRELFQ